MDIVWAAILIVRAFSGPDIVIDMDSMAACHAAAANIEIDGETRPAEGFFGPARALTMCVPARSFGVARSEG